MANEVFVHIGLPKTGTTYLQEVLWGARRALRKDGVLLPGQGHREHLWAALDLQGRSGLARRHPRAPGSLDRLLDEVRSWRGRALLTHEFFCGASSKQASELIDRLAPAEVHVVVTARDTLSMLTAGWQEYVKNGGTAPLREMPPATGARGGEFSWRTWDLGGVLERWGPHLPPERVHVLPMPPAGSAPDQHWHNFADVLGVDPTAYAVPERVANPALGVVQVELLRRVNPHLGAFRRPVDRGTWIRGYLAEQHLVNQQSERPGADADQVAECRRRSKRAVALIRAAGYDVRGDVASLLVPLDLPARPHPDDVPADALVDAATRLVADMLADIRRLEAD